LTWCVREVAELVLCDTRLLHVRFGGFGEAEHAVAVEGVGDPLWFDLGVACVAVVMMMMMMMMMMNMMMMVMMVAVMMMMVMVMMMMMMLLLLLVVVGVACVVCVVGSARAVGPKRGYEREGLV